LGFQEDEAEGQGTDGRSYVAPYTAFKRVVRKANEMKGLAASATQGGGGGENLPQGEGAVSIKMLDQAKAMGKSKYAKVHAPSTEAER
jgi:hypothetical protein